MAYLMDRAYQYGAGSGVGSALSEIAVMIKCDEHIGMFERGELDDLIAEINRSLAGSVAGDKG